jgi:hypothetical protein
MTPPCPLYGIDFGAKLTAAPDAPSGIMPKKPHFAEKVGGFLQSIYAL